MALFRQRVQSPQNVARVEVDRRFLAQAGVPHRHAPVGPGLVHMLDQPADEARGEFAFQGPGGIGVAAGGGEIGYAVEHHAFVEQGLRRLDWRAIDDKVDAAEQLYPQPGRGNDDVGLDLCAGGQFDAMLRKRLDPVGDDRSAPGTHRLEQIAVGHQAKPLIPRIVGWREMRLHVVRLTQRLAHPALHECLHGIRRAARKLEDHHSHQHVLPPRQRESGPFGQDLAQQAGKGVPRGCATM